MIAPISDGDPDPTTQIPWPAARGRPDQQSTPNPASTSPGDVPQLPEEDATKKSKSPVGKRLLSTWDLITLSISMAGAQIAWTVELG